MTIGYWTHAWTKRMTFELTWKRAWSTACRTYGCSRPPSGYPRSRSETVPSADYFLPRQHYSQSRECHRGRNHRSNYSRNLELQWLPPWCRSWNCSLQLLFVPWAGVVSFWNAWFLLLKSHVYICTFELMIWNKER